jgi:hypothetical protein
MNQIGVPGEWSQLIESLVPDILSLIISSWATMPAVATANPREDSITEQLCRLLRMNRTSGDLPFQIHTQMVELDPSAGEDQGRMDIVFLPMVPREDVYFCLECKRLNAPDSGGVRALASEYVTHGMMRFVRGQYAVRVHHGGMLGYVLDGKVAGAIQSVGNLIKKRHKELQIQPPGDLEPSSIRFGDQQTRETRHVRRAQSKTFSIHHMFAAACQTVAA